MVTWFRPVALAALLLVTGCKREPTKAADGVEEVTRWPPPGGAEPHFAWPAMTLTRHQVTETLGADGKIEREEVDAAELHVVAGAAGGVEISMVEGKPDPDAAPLDRALSRHYSLMRIVTHADGQIDHIAGVAEFTAAVKADPDSADGRALFDKPQMREVIEASVEQNYVAWIVTWLDMGWFPEAGRTVRERAGAVTRTLSTVDLSSEAPGRVALHVRYDGPAPKLSVHPTFLIDVLPDERFDEASGFFSIELVCDPRDLIPVRAVIEKDLTAGTGATLVRGWEKETTTFTRRP